MPDRSPLRRSRHRHRVGPDADDATAAALRRLARVTAGAAAEGSAPAPVERDVVVGKVAVAGMGGVGEPSPVAGRPRWSGALADRLPLSLRDATLATTGRAAAALVTVLVLVVLATVLLVWWTRPQATALPRVERVGGVPVGAASAPLVAAGFPSAASSATGSGSRAAQVVVHVAGAVHRPGLVTLPAGSRVADAVAAAGGATRRAQLASVNLARRLVDGEQLVVLRRSQVAAGAAVGAPGAPGPGSGGGGAAAAPGPTGGPVDLNTATLEGLDGLPGIGPVLAQRILDWRTAHGRFGSVDELSEVSGIGEKTLAELRPEVTV